MKNLTYKNISPGVLLFENVLDDVKSEFDFVLKSKQGDDPHFNKNTWQKWNVYGNQSQAWPLAIEENDDSHGAKLQIESSKIFFEMINIYMNNFFDKDFFDKNYYDTNLPKSFEDFMNLGHSNNSCTIKDLVLFEAKTNNYDDFHMLTHQDQLTWWGGPRQIFNCNIYLNDDYEGGEVVFYTYNGEKKSYIDKSSGRKSEAWIMENPFVYKPKAGDALLIQSDAWHTVLPMKGGTSKYYIRQLLHSNSEHPDKINYIKQMGDDYNRFYEEERKKAEKLRITPIQYNSLEDIHLDVQFGNDPDTKVAFIVKDKND